jgi:hypothetical protein
MTTFITQALQRLPWLISAYEGVKDIFGGGKFSEKDISKAAKTETPGGDTGMGGGIMSLLGLN